MKPLHDKSFSGIPITLCHKCGDVIVQFLSWHLFHHKHHDGEMRVVETIILKPLC